MLHPLPSNGPGAQLRGTGARQDGTTPQLGGAVRCQLQPLVSLALGWHPRNVGRETLVRSAPAGVSSGDGEPRACVHPDVKGEVAPGQHPRSYRKGNRILRLTDSPRGRTIGLER